MSIRKKAFLLKKFQNILLLFSVFLYPENSCVEFSFFYYAVHATFSLTTLYHIKSVAAFVVVKIDQQSEPQIIRG